MAKTTAEKVAAYDKYQAINLRSRIRRNLKLEKAVKAGITVTEAEIDAYLKTHPDGK